MGKNGFVFIFIFMILFGGFSSAFAAAPATIIGKFVSTALSPLIKWLWSLKTTSKTAISGRSMMKFESGYTVETVFDGSKLGIEPYSVEVSPSGELLLLDSANSNLYKITQPLSRYSRPRLIAGSAEGYSGHVDGKPRESRMSNPKGLTVDDRGNVYIADTMNMVIRKISDTGVTTIAGGSWGGRGGGHIDGPSEDAKFSNDFDVLYVGSSCSLLIIDRGSQAIREMQLQFDDCAYQYETGFPLGIAVLVAAAFFGYMLALLQRRVGSILSSQKDPRTPRKTNFPPSPYEKPLKASVRPPLIPTEDELEKQEEGLFGSMWKLFLNTGTVFAEIAGGVFSFRRKSVTFQNQHIFQQKLKHSSDWPLQESFVIPDEDEPPPTIESRTPTPRKTYAFMTKDAETHHPLRQSRAYYNGWSGDFQQQQLQQQHQLQQQQLLLQQQQQQQQQQQHQQQQQQQKYYRHQQQNYPSGPKTYYEQSCETTNEIVFGAVQEQDGRREAVVIKAVDYGDPIYNHHNIRSRINYMGYSHGY